RILRHSSQTKFNGFICQLKTSTMRHFGSVMPLIRVILIRITIRWILSGIVWPVQSRWYWGLGRQVVLCCIHQAVGIGPVWWSAHFYSALLSPEALRTETSRQSYIPLESSVSMSIIELVRSHTHPKPICNPRLLNVSYRVG